MRLFFVECENEYSLDLAKTLSGKGFQISHATSHFGNIPQAQLQKRPGFEDASILDSRTLYKSADIKIHYAPYFTPLNAEILGDFETIERDFYILSDRCNYEPISFRARKRYFRDLIRFWLGYLTQEEIEAVYFPCGPHTCWELVLMQACRYLHIPYCYLSHTAINNRSLFRTSYETLEKVPKDYLAGQEHKTVLAGIDKELAQDFLSESIVTNIVKAENDSFNKQSGINAGADYVQKATKPAPNPAISAVKAILRKPYRALFPRRDEFFFPMAMDRRPNARTWEQARKKHAAFARDLKNFYTGNAAPVDYDAPYVYFPLHLQPELTTQPEAMIFEDHLLVLETIVQALPEGWKVYLKENPRQSDAGINTVSAMHYRERSDLEDFLRASDKVHFVPQSEPSEKLISRAGAVVTLTGTAGWEALTTGRPCITMGYPWYSPCRSCYTVSTVDEMERAIKACEKATKESVEADLIRYMHYYQDRLHVSSLPAPSDVSYNTRPYEELLENHANALAGFFKEESVTAHETPAVRISG